jgi:hypothetical protein
MSSAGTTERRGPASLASLRDARAAVSVRRDPLRVDEPVIVLTCARSGSTLLRFILDSHPALACPPETGVIDICSRMGGLSLLLKGPDAHPREGLSDLGADAIRTWVTTMFAGYLTQAGKSRWCEKSLGSAELAGRFLSLFPKARFICLYRSCLDVVDSLHEACPWGLRGYGLEPFTASHPGDSVSAAADYWVCHTRPILEFEQSYPEACLRVRYEDLTTDPATAALRVFGFLGEREVPGLLSDFLAEPRPRFGPADHKIWDTTRVHADSVGRGVRVPVRTLPPVILGMINELHGELGYGQIDEHWNDVAAAHVLSGPAPEAGTEAGPPAQAASQLEELESMLMARLPDGISALGPDALGAGSAFRISAAVRLAGQALVGHWRVDLATASVTRLGPAEAAGQPVGGDGQAVGGDGQAVGGDGQAGDWAAVGDAAIWAAVLTGQVRLAAALRDGRVRVAGRDDDGEPGNGLFDQRVALLTQLIRRPATAT